MSTGINRRNFLKATAVTGAASALTAGCTNDPVENLVPNLVPPEDQVPGVSVHYATSCQECSSQCGVVAKTREGRAVKLEGNVHHPMNQGGLCSIGHASLQALYNPVRIKNPFASKDGNKDNLTWGKALDILGEKLNSAKAKKNSVVYLGQPNKGSFQNLLDSWLAKVNGEKILLDLNHHGSIQEAAKQSFGKEEVPNYHFEKSKVLVNFGADFMESWLDSIENERAYAKFHSYKHGVKGRYVHVGSHLSLTGSNADEWLECSPNSELEIALALVNELVSSARHISSAERRQIRKAVERFSIKSVSKSTGIETAKLKRLANSIGNNGKSLIIGGGNSVAGEESTSLQIAVNLLNHVAGNIGRTVTFTKNTSISSSAKELQNLVQRMNEGKVEVLVTHNVNPVYSLPKSLGFEQALEKVGTVVSLSTAHDESTALADLVLPSSHAYESWGDSNPKPGVHGLQQPVMGRVPGFNTISAGDILIKSAEKMGRSIFKGSYQDFIQESWKKIHRSTRTSISFDNFWKNSLQKGGVFTSPKKYSASFNTSSLKLIRSPKKQAGLKLIPANSVFHNTSGFGGDKPWLLEIPNPISQVVWDSWIEIHPETAVKNGIRHGDLVEVKSSNGTSFEVGAFIYHGIAKDAVSMPTGLGRTVKTPSYSSARGRLPFIPASADKPKTLNDTKVGVNVLDLIDFQTDRSSGDLVFSNTTVSIKSTGKKAYMVTLDGQYRDDIKALRSDTLAGEGDRGQKDRGFIQSIDIKDLLGKGHGNSHGGHHLRERHYTTDTQNNTSMYRDMPENVKDHVFGLEGFQTPEYYKDYKWGMTIDLDRCTGCSACVVACYSENNVPVVGKERQSVGREMSWIRIERYFDKDKKTGEIETNYSPQMCGQCDNAGCEPVCPVYATYHNPEGMNAMIYNRCVGTRYCANNCVYKQRRFNWRTYEFPTPLHMQLNPDVTVREKGVMEKCTFCIQRVREKKDIAKDYGRQVYDGEVKTACQQTCPTDAISFGNLVDPNSRVMKEREENEKRAYIQLEETNFRPAVTYLKKVKHHKKLV